MGKLSHCNHHLEKDLATKTERFKLYKAGKLWLVAGVATFSFGLAQLGVTVDAHADVAPTDTTDVSGQATRSQTIQQKEVALSANSATSNTATSGTVATTSSSAAETVGDGSNATNSNVTTGETGATETTTTEPTAADKTATDVPSVEVPATLDDSDVTTKTVSSEETQATNASASNSSTNNVVRYKNQIGAVSTDGTSTATDTTGTTDGTTADGTTTATTATDKLPAGFSVSDPDYAAGTYAASVKDTGDQYTYFEVSKGSYDLALSTDRDTASKTYVTVAQKTADAWKVLSTQDITEKSKYTDSTTGLTVHNDESSVYVLSTVGTYQIVTNVFGYLDGEYKAGTTTLTSWSGDAVLKPIQQTQTTNYVDQNGNQIADSVQMTGLSGQKYTTEPSTEITGYDPTASANADGYMSPFVENDQTMTEVLYKSGDGAKWGTLTYTVSDVNAGTIDWKFIDATNGANYKGTLTYDIATGKPGAAGAFPSYQVVNPYIPQTTTITYTYDATKVGVNVKYFDDTAGKEISKTQISETQIYGKFNEAISITPIAITGYTYNQDYAATATDNATSYTVTSLANDNTVTLHYTANPETLVIKHVDEDGNEIATADDQTVTSTYNTEVQLTEVDQNYNITGYELATDMPRTYKMVDGENVVTLSYIQQQPITVNYVDQAGQAIDQTLITNPETSLAGIVGETVSVPSPTITGYTAYATNPTNYTVIDGDNAITLKYVKTKVTVSVDGDGNVVDGNGNKITAGTAVDGSQGTDAPVWPTSLTDDGLTGNDQNTNPDVNKDDLDRAIRETVYTLDQTGKVILPSNVWVYFTRTATVDFSNPDKPTVSFGDWTATAGPQTVADATGTDFQPALDYELAQDVTDKAGQSWYLFDATGKALTPVALTRDGQTLSGLAAQQVTSDSKDSTFYIVFTNDKTFTRTINYVNQADQSVVADKVTQTVTYHQIPTLTVTAGTPTVTLGNWTTTAADFAAVDSPTVTGLYALTQTTPAETTDPATSAATESVTVTYVAGQQTVTINYVGLPDALKPTQTSISGDTGTTTTLTPTEVTGYQADAKQYDVSFAVGENGTLVTPSITVTYVVATHGYTITPVTEDNVEIGAPLDEQGTTATTISDGDYPDVEGYTVEPGQNLTVPAGDTPISVIYTPNTVTQKITIPSTTQKGDGTVIDETPVEVEVTGKTGEAVSITVPPKTGYTTKPTTITGTVNPNGTITIPDTTTITYEPKTATQTISIPSTTEDSDGNPTDRTPVTVGVTGKTGDQVPITVPTKTGYTPSQSTVMGTVNPDGTITIPDETTIVYTPNPVKQTIPVPSTTENSSGKVIDDTPVNVEVVGKTGDAVSVTVPPKAGYTPEQATIPATINDDGTVTIPADTTITYQPNTVTQTVTIPTETADSDGTITEDTTPFTIKKTGKTGDSVEITLPMRDGYTTTTPVITATVEPDGTIKVPDGTKVTYTPVEVTQTVTIPTATEGVDGTITDDAKPFTVEETGKTGDAIEITLPPKAGYTPDHATVTATVNDDGTITIPEDETVTYARNTVTQLVTIPTATKGSDGTITDDAKPFTIEETGKTGDAIEITVPSRDGYTTAPATVVATVTPDGTIAIPTDTKVTYTPKETTTTVSIPSTTQDGDGATTDKTPISVKVTGKTGEEVPIAVPEKPGYIASQTSVTGTVKPDGTISIPEETTITYTPKEVTNTVTVPTATEGNDGIVTEDTTPFTVEKTGKTGDSIEVTLPPKAGYTPDQATVTATVNDDGTITIPKDETVTYERNTVTKTVTIPTETVGSDGTITDDDKPFTIEETGKTGDAIEITLPPRDGYTTAPATVTATVTPDGTITIPTDTKVTYTPKEFTDTVTIPSTTQDGGGATTDETPISVEVTGKTGEEVPIAVPEKPGYTASQTSVIGTVNPDGTISISEKTTITYTPNSVTNTVSIPSTTPGSDGGPADTTPVVSDPITGHTGDVVTVDVPTKTGYTPSQTTVTGTINPDGTITTTETVTYTPNTVTGSIVIPTTTKGGNTLPTTNGSFTSTPVTGVTGDTVTVAVEDKPGYTQDKTTVTGTINPDGTITTTEKVTYTPNSVTKTVAIPSTTFKDNKTTVDNNDPVTSAEVTGVTGDNVTIAVPDKPGYTANKTMVTGVVNPNGTITTTEKVTYTPNSVTSTITIPSTTPGNDGGPDDTTPVVSDPVTGFTGETVTVDVPAKAGYTPSQTTVTGTVNPDGTITTTDKVTYTPNTVNKTVSIPSNTLNGDDTVRNDDPVTSAEVTGKTGDHVTVPVPTKEGYTPNKTTVTGVVNPDGTITTTEIVEYTPTATRGTVTIPSTTLDGEGDTIDTNPVKSTPVNGVTGDKVTVPVPTKEGYTSDKTTVTGVVNPDGT
ncbi:MucBP domain-containing protein, partial [Secundilactobacillus muriivasis]